MPKYRVPVEWKEVGHYYIEADNENEAIELANDPGRSLPQGFYLDDSFYVWDDMIEEVTE